MAEFGSLKADVLLQFHDSGDIACMGTVTLPIRGELVCENVLDLSVDPSTLKDFGEALAAAITNAKPQVTLGD